MDKSTSTSAKENISLCDGEHGGDVSSFIPSQELDPFEFLAYPRAFLLDKSELRKKYFEVCRQSREDPARLELAHKSYRTLLDPIARLDYLTSTCWPETPLPNDAQESSPTLDSDIVGLYDELSAASTEEKDRLLFKLNELDRSLYEKIQNAIDRSDLRLLRNYRDKLSYHKKFREMVKQL
ncbi:MAG: hypothetical protein LBF66_00570 [Holosporales bacterium]|jgi:hypothetical protein|nr:hypothetical protein [Holosporales bacterium]